MQRVEKLKALILCAGRGTRLQPLTHMRPKMLIPVANRPILSFIIDKVIEAGLRDIGIVVSPYNGSAIWEAMGDGSQRNINISYIEQMEAGGIAHAVKTARSYLGESDFLLYLGDNLIQGSLQTFVYGFLERKPHASILLKEVDRPQNYGIAEMDAAGNVIKIEEKPAYPRSHYAIPGIYLFTKHLHKAVDRIQPSSRGELEITDSIQEMIDLGYIVESHIHNGWWLDTGTKDDLLNANRFLLDESIPQQDVFVSGDKNIEGILKLGNGSSLRKSRIVGPVAIAPNCRITDCRIGPYVSLGNDCRLEGCAISNSILLDNCAFHHIWEIRDSVMGSGVTIHGHNTDRQEMEFFLADDSRVDIKRG